MNKHRNKQRRISISELTLLGLAVPVLMTGGFVHAWLKNSHVQVMRDIDKTEQRISEHEDSINSLQVKIDRKLNIYQIRDDLVSAGSKLREVPASSVEKISRYRSREVAEASKKPSTLAQVRP